MATLRIAICGIHIESSTFTPYLSVAEDFEVTRGQALLARYPWLTQVEAHPWAERAEWIPVLHARALPGGPIEPGAYQAWKAEIVSTLRDITADAALDGLFFDIHGAMSVPGLEDAEADLLCAIRQVIGPQVLIGASMDLHGNVSRALFADLDQLTCYRTAPHIDVAQTRQRAMANLVAQLSDHPGEKPAKALVHVPILLPGEKTSTRMEPAKSLYAMIPQQLQAHSGVTDVSIWVGFAWADQPRCKAAVVAYGEDRAQVEAVAHTIATAFWERAADFEFVAPTESMEACLTHAEDAPAPFFISDSGDNPGAGGAGDTTYALARLAAWPAVARGDKHAIFASIYDGEVAELARRIGVGGNIECAVGGKIDTRAPGPLPFTGRVAHLHSDPQAGTVAVLRSGGLSLIVTERRFQYGQLADFHACGLDPADADIVIVKMGYLEPDLYAIAADWWMALTPGGVSQDLTRLTYHRIDRPMIPFDPQVIGSDTHPTGAGLTIVRNW